MRVKLAALLFASVAPLLTAVPAHAQGGCTFSPSAHGFVAPAGTLGAGEVVRLHVDCPTGVDYLSLTSTAAGGGTVSVGGAPLVAGGVMAVAMPSTGVDIDYRMPAALPATGIDQLRIRTADSSYEGHVRYAYGKVSRLSFDRSPIAATGSLPAECYWLNVSAGACIPIILTAFDSTGAFLPNAQVWLSMTKDRVCASTTTSCPTGGGASASGVNGATLSATPVALLTGNFGAVRITYSLPGSLPLSGKDTITAQDAAAAPASAATDSYVFG